MAWAGEGKSKANGNTQVINRIIRKCFRRDMSPNYRGDFGWPHLFMAITLSEAIVTPSPESS